MVGLAANLEEVDRALDDALVSDVADDSLPRLRVKEVIDKNFRSFNLKDGAAVVQTIEVERIAALNRGIREDGELESLARNQGRRRLHIEVVDDLFGHVSLMDCLGKEAKPANVIGVAVVFQLDCSLTSNVRSFVVEHVQALLRKEKVFAVVTVIKICDELVDKERMCAPEPFARFLLPVADLRAALSRVPRLVGLRWLEFEVDLIVLSNFFDRVVHCGLVKQILVVLRLHERVRVQVLTLASLFEFCRTVRSFDIYDMLLVKTLLAFAAGTLDVAVKVYFGESDHLAIVARISEAPSEHFGCQRHALEIFKLALADFFDKILLVLVSLSRLPVFQPRFYGLTGFVGEQIEQLRPCRLQVVHLHCEEQVLLLHALEEFAQV